MHTKERNKIFSLMSCPQLSISRSSFSFEGGHTNQQTNGRKEAKKSDTFPRFLFFRVFSPSKTKGGKTRALFYSSLLLSWEDYLLFFFQQGTPMQRLVSLTFFMCLRVLDDHVATILILPSILIPFPLLFFPLPTAQKKKKRTEL